MQVMVNCPSAGLEQWFICDKWLATDEGDGLIERTLYESVGMRKKREKCRQKDELFSRLLFLLLILVSVLFQRYME